MKIEWQRYRKGWGFQMCYEARVQGDHWRCDEIEQPVMGRTYKLFKNGELYYEEKEPFMHPMFVKPAATEKVKQAYAA